MRRSVLFLLLVSLALPAQAQDDARPKNLILMIADGFGPASATLARGVADRPLALDGILTGSISTAATDSRVTDSAAAGTAFACGIKSYNRAIAVDTLGRPCTTLFDAAEARGMATGLVSTSRITHATPASFAAHVPQRSQELDIAAQLVASGVEVLFGGGLRMFVPEEDGGDRDDSRDLRTELQHQGHALALDRNGFDALRATPASALLADDHMAYEVDRDPAQQPSLAEMTTKALALLSQSTEGQREGFLLMIEGARIDHAAHGNDLAGHVHDILAYDAAVQGALDFAEANGQTLVVSVADHETGGMTLGRDGVYAWDPAVLRTARASREAMRARISAGDDVLAVVREGTAVDSLNADEAAALRAAHAAGDSPALDRAISAVLSARAGIGWTTTGHTAVDITLYAFGPDGGRLRGHLPNDAVGRILFDLMGFAWAEPGASEDG
ncbi:MAG: alkaline phosphatase [Rhodothermaceae bacterium]|nr:alkaline phosphatase [Rhodothermaceae bacterium]